MRSARVKHVRRLLGFGKNAQPLGFRESALSLIEGEEDVRLQDECGCHLQDVEGTCPELRGMASRELLGAGVRLDRNRTQGIHAAAVQFEIPEYRSCLSPANELSKNRQLNCVDQLQFMQRGEVQIGPRLHCRPG